MFARQDANVTFEAWVTDVQIDLNVTFSADLDTLYTEAIYYKDDVEYKRFSVHGCA